jgi:hypothetical protein
MRRTAGDGLRLRDASGSAGGGPAHSSGAAAGPRAAREAPDGAAVSLTAEAIALARYGTTEPVAPVRRVALGPVTFAIADGAVRTLAYDGIEVIRGLGYAVRDRNWGTLATTTLSEDVSTAGSTLCYRRVFAVGYDFDGDVRVTVTEDSRGVGVVAALSLAALRDVVTNRVGFVVLHPIAGVAGEPVDVRRPDGTVTRLAFPPLVAAAQPARSIAGLAHVVRGVAVDIAFEGEVFEMEDERNWMDAAFKTCSRPLSAPRPGTIPAGERIEQQIAIRLRRHAVAVAGAGRAAAPGGAPLDLAFTAAAVGDRP